MAVFGAGSLLSQLLAGAPDDRIGRRATLSGGMVATAAAMLALGYSTTLAAITGLDVPARAGGGRLPARLQRPGGRPGLAGRTGRRAYGLLFWAINLGYSVGMMAGGWLAQPGSAGCSGSTPSAA